MAPCSNKPSHIYASKNLFIYLPLPMSWGWAQRQPPGLSSKAHTQSLWYPTKSFMIPCLWFSQRHVEVYYLSLFSQPVLQSHFTFLCQQVNLTTMLWWSPLSALYSQVDADDFLLYLTMSGRIVSGGLLYTERILIILFFLNKKISSTQSIAQTVS